MPLKKFLGKSRIIVRGYAGSKTIMYGDPNQTHCVVMNNINIAIPRHISFWLDHWLLIDP